MLKESKDGVLLFVKTFIISLILIGVSFLFSNTTVKWIIYILAGLLGIASLFFLTIILYDDYKKLQKSGEFADIEKVSFDRKLKNDTYRQNLLRKIPDYLDKDEETYVSLSRQDIVLIVIDLKKAEKLLSAEQYKKVKSIYTENTTVSKPVKTAKYEHCRRITKKTASKTDIYEKKHYYDEISLVLETYSELADIESITALSPEECSLVTKLIEQEKEAYITTLDNLYAELSPLGYTRAVIEDKFNTAGLEDQHTITSSINRISKIRSTHKELTDFFSAKPLESLFEKVRLGVIAFGDYKTELLTYLENKHTLKGLSPEKIQEELDEIIVIFENKPRGPSFLCGTPFIESKKAAGIDPTEQYYEHLSSAISEIEDSDYGFEEKITALYNIPLDLCGKYLLFPSLEARDHGNKITRELLDKYITDQYYALYNKDTKF